MSGFCPYPYPERKAVHDKFSRSTPPRMLDSALSAMFGHDEEYSSGGLVFGEDMKLVDVYDLAYILAAKTSVGIICATMSEVDWLKRHAQDHDPPKEPITYVIFGEGMSSRGVHVGLFLHIGFEILHEELHHIIFSTLLSTYTKVIFLDVAVWECSHRAKITTSPILPILLAYNCCGLLGDPAVLTKAEDGMDALRRAFEANEFNSPTTIELFLVLQAHLKGSAKETPSLP